MLGGLAPSSGPRATPDAPRRTCAAGRRHVRVRALPAGGLDRQRPARHAGPAAGVLGPHGRDDQRGGDGGGRQSGPCGRGARARSPCGRDGPRTRAAPTVRVRPAMRAASVTVPRQRVCAPAGQRSARRTLPERSIRSVVAAIVIRGPRLPAPGPPWPGPATGPPTGPPPWPPETSGLADQALRRAGVEGQEERVRLAPPWQASPSALNGVAVQVEEIGGAQVGVGAGDPAGRVEP